MSLFGSVARLAKKGIGAAGALSKIPVLGSALKAVPFVGTGLAAMDMASSAMGMMGGGGGGSRLPALSGGPRMTASGGLPALPGSGGGAPVIVGQRKILRNDANVPDALKAFTISKGDLRQYYRSPLKGYVIRHDPNGDPFAIPKQMAKAYLGWRPAKKPPISIGEYQSLKRAHRTIRKVTKIHGLISYVAAHTTDSGKVKIHRKKGGHK